MQVIKEKEVKRQLDRTKKKKATGPEEFPIEVVRNLGNAGIAWMRAVLQDIQINGIALE